ncbi:MAG: aldehyde dehydrogenase family protein [Trinickia sp.]|uniref:aldehyde dehydrogenase family protein n=1 Tax=Trinickia sp. TaxID=2571163 RepID=UPI003F8070C1
MGRFFSTVPTHGPLANRLQFDRVRHLNYPAWDPQAPFGGYKQSGNVREYGIEGMKEYTEVKSVLGYYD